MHFHRVNPNNDLAAMFRPAGTLFETRSRNEKWPSKTMELVYDVLFCAYGEPIKYDETNEVVEVRGFVEKEITENTWYWNRKDYGATLSLTSEEQMQYIALTVNNITVNDPLAEFA